MRFIEVVKDYSQLSEDKEMQQTIVYKLKQKASTVNTTQIELGTLAEVDKITDATADSVHFTSATASAVLPSLDELQFLAKPHRELIVTCLDSMRQIILQSHNSFCSASGLPLHPPRSQRKILIKQGLNLFECRSQDYSFSYSPFCILLFCFSFCTLLLLLAVFPHSLHFIFENVNVGLGLV